MTIIDITSDEEFNVSFQIFFQKQVEDYFVSESLVMTTTTLAKRLLDLNKIKEFN